MKVFKKVTAIAAALALLGGSVLASSSQWQISDSAIGSRQPYMNLIYTDSDLNVHCHNLYHSASPDTWYRESTNPGTAAARTASITIQALPTSAASTANKYSLALDPHTTRILTILINTALLNKITPSGLIWEEHQPFIESLITYASDPYKSSYVPTKLLLGDFEKIEELYELLSTEHTNSGDLSQLEYELDALKSDYDYQIQKLLTPPWHTQKCQLVAHPLIDNPVLGSYSGVQIMACFPDCMLVPKNVKITFGLSLNGDEQKEIPPCIQANHAIIHIRQLRGANEFGYFYVDVEGTDQENPVRPFTIRKNIPKKVLRYLQARF